MAKSKEQLYVELLQETQALLEGESDLIANLANASALIWNKLPDINWSGFYINRDDELVLGPFQGKPACVRIPIGRGVCGAAAKTLQPQIVVDVNQFEGHIACDVASNSEIVLPLMAKGQLMGVLDIDSPQIGRFDDEDLTGLKQVVSVIEASFQ